MIKTNQENAHTSNLRKEVTSPSTPQLLRQLGMIALIIIIWSSLLVLTISLTGKLPSEPTS